RQSPHDVLVFPFTLAQSLLCPFAMSAIYYQSCDEQRLGYDDRKQGYRIPLVLVPKRRRAKPHNAAGWQKVFANSPSLKLAPVKYGFNWDILYRDVLPPRAVCNLKGDIRSSGPIRFDGANITANDPSTDFPTG